MRKKGIKTFGLFGLLAVSISLLAGCQNKPNDNKNDIPDEVITNIIEKAEPSATVEVGPFETSFSNDTQEIDESMRHTASTAIYDMPKDEAINIIYNNDEENLNFQAVNALLENIVTANDELQTISIKDREGNKKGNCLSARPDKIILSNPGGFEYGEIYVVELNNAPYLAFEGRDKSIRKLTIEIEDDPNEAATYDVKELKNNIVEIDRELVRNRVPNPKNEKSWSFDYDGELPPMMDTRTPFYATKKDNPDGNLDFYGLFISKNKNKDGSYHIVYEAPNIDDLYTNLRLKGKEQVSLENAEILVNENVAIEQFKQSNMARSIVKMAASRLAEENHDKLGISPETINMIINIIRHIDIGLNLNIVGSRVETKWHAGCKNVKLTDKLYFSLEIGHETITDYTFDFDLKVRTAWIVPTGVDYKVKVIEDTQELNFVKVNFDVRLMDDIPSDTKFAEQIMDNMEKEAKGEASAFSCLADEDGDHYKGPSAGGTRTTWPLAVIDIDWFTPLDIKFKIDFYMDAAISVMGFGKKEVHTTKIDICYTNMDGGGDATDQDIKEASNWAVFIAGGVRFEVGLRISIGISLFGLYDYLHAEAFAEVYFNVSFNGLLGMNFDVNQPDAEFTGFIGCDFSIAVGFRTGFHFKAVVWETTISWNWSTYIFRVSLNNNLEHWSDTASTTIEMNKQTMSLDETSALWIKYYDPLTWTLKEKQFSASERFSIFSGLLVPKAKQSLFSGYMFEYHVDNPNLLEISNTGVIHVKDGTASSFTTTFKIHVSNWVGWISDRTITINYTASDTLEAYAGDDLIDAYRPGYTFVLPEAKKIYGMAFDYYSYEGIRYDVGDKFTMPHNTVKFEMHYHELPKYYVYFYDGFNRLVAFDEVYEGYAAVAPFAEMRDRYMDDDWLFMSWDKAFDDVRHEMHVYGIYFRMA